MGFWMIIGLSGFISSGKDTVADIIEKKYNFSRESFADSVKDCLSSIFNWDRNLLEGKTTESRVWRDTVDEWWSKRLNIQGFTPRYAMQHFATNICRNYFHDELWIASLENKIASSNKNIIISDVRFINELQSIKRAGGYVIRIKKGNDPSWFDTAVMANYGDQKSKNLLEKLNVHVSETEWIGYTFDYIIENNGSLTDLETNISILMENLESNLPVSTVNLANEVAFDNWHILS